MAKILWERKLKAKYLIKTNQIQLKIIRIMNIWLKRKHLINFQDKISKKNFPKRIKILKVLKNNFNSLKNYLKIIRIL